VAYVRRKSNAFTRGKSRYRGVSGHNGRWEARIGTFGGRKNVRCGQASCARVPIGFWSRRSTAKFDVCPRRDRQPDSACWSPAHCCHLQTGLPSEMRFSISATISER